MNAFEVKLHEALNRPPASPFLQALNNLRPQMAQAVQEVVDAWEQDEEGIDWQYGAGGICDAVAQAIGEVLVMNIPDIELVEGGQPGDDHAYNYVHNGQEAFEIDVDYGLYERGGGMRWTKVEGAQITPDDIQIHPINITDILGPD